MFSSFSSDIFSEFSDETIPSLGAGLFKSQFKNFMMGVLQDWRIIDVYRERVFEAIEFQYTDWPDPENRSARAQEFINVSSSAVLFTLGPSYNEQFNSQKFARYNWYSLYPSFSNIDANEKHSF